MTDLKEQFEACQDASELHEVGELLVDRVAELEGVKASLEQTLRDFTEAHATPEENTKAGISIRMYLNARRRIDELEQRSRSQYDEINNIRDQRAELEEDLARVRLERDGWCEEVQELHQKHATALAVERDRAEQIAHALGLRADAAFDKVLERAEHYRRLRLGMLTDPTVQDRAELFALGRADEREIWISELNARLDHYPESVFPQPDLVLARKALEAHGLTLDAVSACAIRLALKSLRDDPPGAEPERNDSPAARALDEVAIGADVEPGLHITPERETTEDEKAARVLPPVEVTIGRTKGRSS